MKNINKIELLAQGRCLLSNTSSWLVLQSFHPPSAGFFLAAFLSAIGGPVPAMKKGPAGPLSGCAFIRTRT
ncbi:hypothetical protein BS650_10165 [Aeromonas hydrophila]|nr:hypothetical protein [Aeromonas hydrophila]OLO01077.1 hypothetical protein BS650_10165 [Aeromonas hydrophila]ORJ68699.1 hypothetical protein B5717_05370 [Aeromonas hydrophila]OSO92786.1 hypothetical protein B7E00_05775 [Aeromonas hydrophila]QBX72759.1 hypothetical protein E4625_19195 [Aeromonas hydrophila]